ncbi:MAG TPA: ABC transporter substrate-binding protein [Tenuifilaceae bacterium]|nr:ABC transporter substrate-binding protein [Tenuifilaceae bacterium]
MNFKHFIFVWALLFVACNTEHRSDFQQNVFRYNESKGITSLDPAYARNLALIWPVVQIFNGLVQLSDSLTVEPCIAKCWNISDDGLEYTFTLRHDVFFQASEVFPNGVGRRVTAQDFVFSFNRIMNSSVASPGLWVMSSIDKGIAGFENGCKAINDSTFTIRLKHPFPPFLGMLSMPYCFVVPHEAVSRYGKDFGRHPVGTGPFYLKYWKNGEKLVLRRNPNYFEIDSTGRRLPYLEAVNITFTADKQSEFMDFLLGNTDFLSGIHPVSKDELLTKSGRLNSKYSSKVQMITGPYLNTEYLGILLDTSSVNCNKTLQNFKVRKAMACGFDRKSMIRFLRGNIGYAATQGFVPPAMQGFRTADYGYDYNPELSRKLLAEAGFPNGNGLEPITISTTDDYVDICEYIQHQLGEVGFTVNIDVLPGAAYRDMLANSKLQVFRASWVADYADPENYLSLFLSENFSPEGPNYTHFSSAKFDKLYSQAMRKSDYGKRLPFYRQMDSLVVSNAVVIPLYYDKVVRFASTRVKGLTVNPMNLLVLKKVKVE